MGCCGDREKHGDLRSEQKWDYINLDDFKSTSCWTPFAYGYLLIMLVVSISVYCVDIFTAVNLLVFDKWSGQIEPKIPFTISRWIFAGCIILSLLLLLYRWLRAIRVMRQGGVAKSYLDPLAIRLQSIRMGSNGRGWKRFLVFAELTKSRKGADYVALFTYYSFEAWLRILFAEGPRQALNAITLFSVLQLQLLPTEDHPVTDGHTPIVQFFVNIGILADSNKFRAVILFGMLWTLFIWVISAIGLIVSVVLYLLFLWHHIPTEDGSLTKYCRNKINRRMERIVKVKVDKALKRENELRAREEARAARDGKTIKKQPTLPSLGHPGVDVDPTLSRQNTMTTLPEYTSRPPTRRASNDTLPSMSTLGDMPQSRRPDLNRSGTHASEASWSSYSSNAPLINHHDMASPDYNRVQTPNSAGASSGSYPWGSRPGVARSATGNYSQHSHSSGPPRPGTAHSHRNAPGTYAMEPIPRPPTSTSNTRRYSPPRDDDTVDEYPFPRSEDRAFSPLSATARTLPYPVGSHDQPRDHYDSQPSTSAIPRHMPSLSDKRGRNPPLDGPPVRTQTPLRQPSERSYPSTSIPERLFNPVGAPPDRTMTPVGGPMRSMTPAASASGRSTTPAGPLERSFTPAGLPATRSMTPGGSHSRLVSADREPTLPTMATLPRLQTTDHSSNNGYIPYTAEPQKFSAASADGPLRGPSSRNLNRPNEHSLYPAQANHQHVQRMETSLSDRGPPSRQDSGVDDILSHY